MTPHYSLLFFLRSELDDLREEQVTQNVTTFFISFLSFAGLFIHEVRYMIWIKNYIHATMNKDNNRMQCRFVVKRHLIAFMLMKLKSTMHEMQLIEKPT